VNGPTAFAAPNVDADSATTWSPRRTSLTIAIISVVAGLMAAGSGAEPTGDATIDLVLVGFTVAGVTWLGAAAMRWDAAMVTLVAALLSISIVGTIIGIAAAVCGFVVPVRPGRRSVVNAFLIAIALNIAARSNLQVFLGASVIVFLALAASVGAVGFARRPRRSRQVTVIAIGTAVSLAFLGAFAFGVFGYLALDDLRAGNEQARQGLEQLGDGDLDAAQASFVAAAASFTAADDSIDMPMASLARYVPGLAQHYRVATELTRAASDASERLALELERIDLDALSASGGSIDIEQVSALQSPLNAIALQVEGLQRTLADVDSRWLVPPLAARMDDLAADLARQQQRGDDAMSVAIAAPGLLGGDEPRTYFIGFTTPSEARGIGGFMGNWAEVTVDQGQITLSKFGRADDLNSGGDPATRRFTTGTTSDADSAPTAADPQLDEWLTRYGRYNLTSGPDGTTGPEPWKNINMSPDMAATGRAIADLYPKSGGGQLDGAFMMDVYTLARFLEFTGPIALPNGETLDGQSTVTADTAAKFLLHDQYDLTTTQERVDILEDFSRSVIETLLGRSLPSPMDLLDILGPMVDQGRFTGWAARPDEQAVLQQIGISGTLPGLGTGDGLAVVFNNAAGNKIDYYLGADATYDVTADASTGSATARLSLTLTNGAPPNGEPNYVIGNLIGLPDGHNRTWVSIFSRLPVTAVALDGLPVDVEPGAEAGYFVTSAFVALPPGGTGTLTLEMSGPIDVFDGYDLSMRTPPTVAPTPVVVHATWLSPDGTALRSTLERRDPGTATLSVTADR